MNKTIPQDGKKTRRSQDYVPTGPIYSSRYFIRDRYATKAASIARRFGEVIEIDDGVRSRIELYPKWTYAMSVRKREQQIKVIAKHRCCSATTKLIISSDESGHRALCEELTNEFGNFSGGPFSTWRRPEEEIIEDKHHPPVTKRLTGKERKIAKRKAAEQSMSGQKEESS